MNIEKILKILDKDPQKSLGQNFLKNNETIEKIIDSFKLNDNENNILEIGPGLGALTEYLIPISEKIYLIEKDKKLFLYLKNKYQKENNIIYFNEDILNFNWEIIPNNNKIIVIGNLPYNIATKILQTLLTKSNIFEKLFLSFPEELGEKILAEIKTKKYGYLTIFSNFFSFPKKIIKLKDTDFYPEPKIKSVFIEFVLKKNYPIDEYEIFFTFIKQCFKHKRKTLLNNLKTQLNYDTTNKKIELFFQNKKWKKTIRPEEIDLEDWINLYKIINY